MSSNKPASTAPSANSGLFSKIETVLESNKWWLLALLMLLTALLAFWQFNPRLSFATDDAGYIKRAYLFMTEGTFPTYQGPLYPMFLSLIMLGSGLDLLVLKYASLWIIVAQVGVLFLAFHKRVPNLVLFAVLLALVLNPYYLHYASYTFNEAFMMLIQALAFWLILARLHSMEASANLAKSWKAWLIYGLMLLLLMMTKSVAILSFAAFALYFLLKKKWWQAVYALGFFGAMVVAYRVLMENVLGIVLSSQTEQLKRKNFYDPSQGYEDLAGYLTRFYENFGSYVSVHFYKILGLRGAHSFTILGEAPLEAAKPSYLFSLIFIGLAVFSLILLFKHNKFALLALFYAAAIFCVSFFALQSMWNQDRLILPYIPLVLLGFFSAMYYWVANRPQKYLQPVLIIVFVILAFIQLPLTVKVAKNNAQIRAQYKRGNEMYGLSPAIASFAEACNWAGNNLGGTDIKIVTNKPEEAFVYGKGLYFNRINAKGKSADELLALLKEGAYTHILLDRLGSNAGLAYQTINNEYPEKLSLVIQAGQGNFATYLFKISY